MHLYKVYPSRWRVLLAVAALNIAINTLLLSFSSVATSAAFYYEKDPNEVDTLTSVGFFLSIPSGFLVTWLVEKIGLKKTVWTGAGLCFFAGLIRMVSTFPGIGDVLDKDLQFWIAVVAQGLNGVANPMAYSLPTKVAEDWFPEHEAPIATGLITMSFVFGVTIASGITPLIFTHPEDIPYMNIAWFVPSAISAVITVSVMRRDKPPTPPSASADLENKVHLTYLTKMKVMLTNPRYLLLMVCIGSSIGYFNAFISKVQQLGCSQGYTTEIVGVGVTLLLVCGLFGGITGSMLARRTQLFEELAKIFYGLVAPLAMGVLMVLSRPKVMEGLLLCLMALCGIFGFGVLPLGAELSIENIYPVDPAAGISVMFLFGQVESALLLYLSGVLEDDISQQVQEMETCTEVGGEENAFFEAKDHTKFLLLMEAVMFVCSVTFLIFFKTQYKRRNANHEGEEETSSAHSSDEKGVKSVPVQ